VETEQFFLREVIRGLRRGDSELFHLPYGILFNFHSQYTNLRVRTDGR